MQQCEGVGGEGKFRKHRQAFLYVLPGGKRRSPPASQEGPFHQSMNPKIFRSASSAQAVRSEGVLKFEESGETFKSRSKFGARARPNKVLLRRGKITSSSGNKNSRQVINHHILIDLTTDACFSLTKSHDHVCLGNEEVPKSDFKNFACPEHSPEAQAQAKCQPELLKINTPTNKSLDHLNRERWRLTWAFQFPPQSVNPPSTPKAALRPWQIMVEPTQSVSYTGDTGSSQVSLINPIHHKFINVPPCPLKCFDDLAHSQEIAYARLLGDGTVKKTQPPSTLTPLSFQLLRPGSPRPSGSLPSRHGPGLGYNVLLKEGR